MGIYGKPADLKLEQGRQLIWQRVCDCPLVAAQGSTETRGGGGDKIRHPKETLFSLRKSTN